MDEATLPESQETGLYIWVDPHGPSSFGLTQIIGHATSEAEFRGRIWGMVKQVIAPEVNSIDDLVVKKWHADVIVIRSR